MTEPDLDTILGRLGGALDADDRKAALACLEPLTDLPPDAAVLVTDRVIAVLRDHGTRTTALACVNALRPHLPKTADLALFRVDLLIRIGKLGTARKVLDGLTAHDDRPMYWQCRLALDVGADQLSQARADIGAARAAAKDGAGLRVAEIKALIAAEEYDTAAARLDLAIGAYPDTPALHVQRIALAQIVDGAQAALPIARQAADRFPDALHLQLALGEALRRTGQRTEAETHLRATADRFPRSALPHVRLARLAIEVGLPDVAFADVTEARARDKGTLPVELAYADVTLRLGRTEEAVARLEWLVGNDQITPALLVKLIAAHRSLGQSDEADSYARLGQEMFPGSATLVEYLAPLTAGLDLGLDPDAVADSLPASRRDALTARMALRALELDTALEAARRPPTAQRGPSDIKLVASALMQAGRLPLVWRYLRFALTHWAADPGIVSLFAQASNKVGRPAAALATLADRGIGADSTSPTTLSNLALLHASGGHSVPAMAAFEACLGAGGFPQRNTYRMLMRCLIGDGRADLLERLLDIQESANLWTHPHLQKSLNGQLQTEARLALRMGAAGETEDGEASGEAPGGAERAARLWAHPGSNIAAMAVVGHWVRHASDGPDAVKPVGTDGAAVPRQIFQYWDRKTPPSRIAAMMTTWRLAPGYKYRCYDRREAMTYLADKVSPEARRAFQLARNPAEEADFLRLCLLHREGGIYADADDRRDGDLNRFIADRTGLTVLVEPGLANVANNFLIAAPSHPVLAKAVDMAQQALLARDAETTWSKTGPGLLTRALASHLGDCLVADVAPEVTPLGLADIAEVVSIHNPAEHKGSATDWRGLSREG